MYCTLLTPLGAAYNCTVHLSLIPVMSPRQPNYGTAVLGRHFSRPDWLGGICAAEKKMGL